MYGIGVMSGTSVDSIDLSYVKISKTSNKEDASVRQNDYYDLKRQMKERYAIGHDGNYMK